MLRDLFVISQRVALYFGETPEPFSFILPHFVVDNFLTLRKVVTFFRCRHGFATLFCKVIFLGESTRRGAGRTNFIVSRDAPPGTPERVISAGVWYRTPERAKSRSTQPVRALYRRFHSESHPETLANRAANNPEGPYKRWRKHWGG